VIVNVKIFLIGKHLAYIRHQKQFVLAEAKCPVKQNII